MLPCDVEGQWNDGLTGSLLSRCHVSFTPPSGAHTDPYSTGHCLPVVVECCHDRMKYSFSLPHQFMSNFSEIYVNSSCTSYIWFVTCAMLMLFSVLKDPSVTPTLEDPVLVMLESVKLCLIRRRHV